MSSVCNKTSVSELCRRKTNCSAGGAASSQATVTMGEQSRVAFHAHLSHNPHNLGLHQAIHFAKFF